MIGTLIAGKYELLGEAGRGTVGVVYKARNRDDGSTVAIKVIDRTGGDPTKIKRFEQGISAARVLEHPNIVTTIDAGLLDNEKPFYVMRFVEGQLLSQVLAKEKRLPLARVVRIASHLCDAIEFAHYHGVVHRNLKPANIMLVPQRDGTETVQVLDFGLAKSFFESGKPQERLTAAGDIIGLPEYMSPEQCMWKPVDWRSDIYSMGCVLFEMLTGQVPIRGMNILDTLMKQAREQPMTFAEAAPDLVIPGAVQEAIMRALEKDPNARQQTMIQLKEELQSGSDTVASQAPELDQLRAAAESGNAQKQYELGCFMERMHTTQNIAEIAEWFQRAADQGHADACFRMGQAYELGLGVKRSSDRAVQYYRTAGDKGRDDARVRAIQLAAFEGDVDAQIKLAMMHKSGNLVAQNLGETEKWLQKAAEKRFAFSGDISMEPVIEFAFSLANREHAEAAYWLGIIYKDGRGVPADTKLSAKWLIRSSDRGHGKATTELATLPQHIVDEVRRGRPKWDHRVTSMPHMISPESKKLIEAVQNLRKKDTLKHRFDLWESFREATLFVAYEDPGLTRIAAVADADGAPAAAVFTEFSALNKWQQAMDRAFPWAERKGAELAMQWRQINGASLVLDQTDAAGITMRHWEIDALATNAQPVERGAFLTELQFEKGQLAFSRIPSRPPEGFHEVVRALLSGVPWIQQMFLIEAVFEPVKLPSEMTFVAQTNRLSIPPSELRRVGDSLRSLLLNELRSKQVRVLFVTDSAEVTLLRRSSICVYQRGK